MTHDECKQHISQFLKTQPLPIIQSMLETAQAEGFVYTRCSQCLLGLSEGGYEHGRMIAAGFGHHNDICHLTLAEAAFHALAPRNDPERNRLMIPILEAELLRRKLEAVSTEPIAEPENVSMPSTPEEEAIHA